MYNLVPRKYWHATPKLLQLAHGTNASTSVAAAATGVSLVPIFCNWSAASLAAHASYTIFAGTSGSTLMTIQAGGLNNGEISYWDAGVTPAKAIVIDAANNPGSGQINVWYIAVRLGAGEGGLVL